MIKYSYLAKPYKECFQISMLQYSVLRFLTKKLIRKLLNILEDTGEHFENADIPSHPHLPGDTRIFVLSPALKILIRFLPHSA